MDAIAKWAPPNKKNQYCLIFKEYLYADEPQAMWIHKTTNRGNLLHVLT